jgi:hypothetical protein
VGQQVVHHVRTLLLAYEIASRVEPLQLRTHASALGRGGSFHIYISNEGLLHGCIKQSFRIKIAIDIFISEDYMLG